MLNSLLTTMWLRQILMLRQEVCVLSFSLLYLNNLRNRQSQMLGWDMRFLALKMPFWIKSFTWLMLEHKMRLRWILLSLNWRVSKFINMPGYISSKMWRRLMCVCNWRLSRLWRLSWRKPLLPWRNLLIWLLQFSNGVYRTISIQVLWWNLQIFPWFMSSSSELSKRIFVSRWDMHFK